LYFLIAVYFKGIFFPLSALALGIMIGLVLLEIINFYIKASIHVAVVCSFVITMGLLYGGMVFLLLCVMAPLVAWSRLFLKKHTAIEVIAGTLFGSFVTSLTFFIGKLLL
jgi:membrane-associated phospholipid phosphatase